MSPSELALSRTICGRYLCATRSESGRDLRESLTADVSTDPNRRDVARAVASLPDLRPSVGTLDPPNATCPVVIREATPIGTLANV
jgi:hypothetical protein